MMDRFASRLDVDALPEVVVRKNSPEDLKQVLAAYQGEREIIAPMGNYPFAEADLPLEIDVDRFKFKGKGYGTNIYHAGTANPSVEMPIFNIHRHGGRVKGFQIEDFRSMPSYLANIDYTNRTLFRIEGSFNGEIKGIHSEDNGHFLHMLTDATHQNRRVLIHKCLHYYTCGYVFLGEASGYVAGEPADCGAIHFRTVWQHNDSYTNRHQGLVTPHTQSGGYSLAGGDGGLVILNSNVEYVNQYGIRVVHGATGSGTANGQNFFGCTIERAALGSDIGGERHHLTDMMFASGQVDGLILRASAKGLRLKGCNFRDNGMGSAGTYDGLKLVDVLNASVLGCGSYNQSSGAKYQKYGFDEIATSDYNVYVACQTINIADIAKNVFAANSKADANNNQWRA